MSGRIIVRVVDMETDQTKIGSLYAEVSRIMIWFGCAIVAAWIFAALSYYLSRKTGTDWFSRSGSVMALTGAVASFRVMNIYQSRLVMALNEGLVSVSREVELALEPPRSFRMLAYFGYLTGVVGTGIWGYGDLLLR
jgi:hypothetical protein